MTGDDVRCVQCGRSVALGERVTYPWEDGPRHDWHRGSLTVGETVFVCIGSSGYGGKWIRADQIARARMERIGPDEARLVVETLTDDGPTYGPIVPRPDDDLANEFMAWLAARTEMLRLPER